MDDPPVFLCSPSKENYMRRRIILTPREHPSCVTVAKDRGEGDGKSRATRSGWVEEVIVCHAEQRELRPMEHSTAKYL